MIRRTLSFPAAAALAALTACAEPEPRPLPAARDLPLRGTKTIAPMPRPDFTVTDTEGRAYDFRARTEGRIALLFFGYTFCPDICPIHMASLASALEELPREARDVIDVVFVTVDPERDTPERLRGWLATFDSSFVGLRGTPEQIEAALAFFRYPAPTRSADGPVYTVGHPALIYAFTPDGLTHVMYGPETPRAAWVHDLTMLAGYPWDEAPAAARDPAEGHPLAVAGDVAVLDAFVPEPPGGSPAALYLTLRNDGTVDDTLTSLGSPAAAQASIHDVVTVDGMTRMSPMSFLVVPAGATVRLTPGGRHGMLEDMAGGALTAGGTVDVILTFAHAGALTVRARVVHYDDLPGA